MWVVSISFLKSCIFFESRFKSYGKRVGNTRQACQGLGHQATLACCQVNCWIAAWQNYKSPRGQLVFPAPGWALPLALPRFGQVGRQEGTTGDSWAMWSCCDHSWCQQPGTKPTPPLFLLTKYCKRRLQLPKIYYTQLLVQSAYSVTKLFFPSHLKFNYSCAIGRTRYFHPSFSLRTMYTFS